MLAIVDTNVGVVANQKAEQASPGCVSVCALKLQEIREQGTLVIDDNWLVLSEYQRQLRSTGQPGPGNEFLKWVLRNQANAELCQLIHLDCCPTPGANSALIEPEFVGFPKDEGLATFDPSDRKFVALCIVHPKRPPILNAVDRGWWDHRHALARQGVQVDFLCPEAMEGSRRAAQQGRGEGRG